MPTMAFPEAFKELRARNLAVATVYREWSRRLPPGPVSKLAASIAEQRRDLDKALAEIAADQSPRGAEVEFELAPAQAEGVSSEDSELSEPKAILRKIVAAEAADHDLLAEAAGSALSLSTEIAERLAAEAASARKRSIWAQDQLELMEML